MLTQFAQKVTSFSTLLSVSENVFSKAYSYILWGAVADYSRSSWTDLSRGERQGARQSRGKKNNSANIDSCSIWQLFITIFPTLVCYVIQSTVTYMLCLISVIWSHRSQLEGNRAIYKEMDSTGRREAGHLPSIARGPGWWLVRHCWGDLKYTVFASYHIVQLARHTHLLHGLISGTGYFFSFWSLPVHTITQFLRDSTGK